MRASSCDLQDFKFVGTLIGDWCQVQDTYFRINREAKRWNQGGGKTFTAMWQRNQKSLTNKKGDLKFLRDKAMSRTRSYVDCLQCF